MGTINGIVSESSEKGAMDQHSFIAEISERLAGYTEGIQFRVLEYGINKTEMISPDGTLLDTSHVSLEIRIETKD